MEHQASKDICHLCAKYCTLCRAQITAHASYYRLVSGETTHCICITCRKKLGAEEEQKNDEGQNWVQCSKCHQWLHNVCALYNPLMDEDGKEPYTCPQCRMNETESPSHDPKLFRARNLQKTRLSRYLYRRLKLKLNSERKERARAAGKVIEEVPTADHLVVRVVSSVHKIVKVQPEFMKMFQETRYPTEFPNKSKVVLLFQDFQGADVCIFAMFVHEYGAECPPPNQRIVHLSYLDSVKYFRPDVLTVSKEALRTFVYHEILLGYLEDCKARGFKSCYIWASPPREGRDYVFNCKPQNQRIPDAGHLCKWYTNLLKKAQRDGIIVEITNLYDWFSRGNEHSKTLYATRMPYLGEQDFWPALAEDLIGTNRALNRRDLDWQLGQHLIYFKERFILVHFQYAPTQDTKDEETIDAKLFDTPSTFLNFCQSEELKFDTLHRARYSSMILLYYLRSPNASLLGV